MADATRTTVLYSGRILRLVLQETPLPDGAVRRREIVEHADGAAVVAVDDTGQVILVRQRRPAVGRHLLELPAGLVDPGETPRACAGRELQEENGLVADRLEPLASFYTSPGFTTERLHVFAARGLRPGRAGGDPDEQVEVVRLPLADALARLQGGEISDAKTIVGLLAYATRHPERR